jgi:Phage capsid family/Caudovirus prohead serine protease
MDFAYSRLTVKTVSEDQRVIRGWATTPEPDRIGDIVEPLGVTFKNPLPLLVKHDPLTPVGTVEFDPPTARGVEFTATLPRIAEPGALRERVETAWGEIKAGLVRAVSIGFRALDGGVERIKGGGLRFAKTEVLELSLVTIPANASASITHIRSLDRKHRAADRSPDAPIQIIPPGRAVSDHPPATGDPPMPTIGERIQSLETLRGHKAARIDEVLQKALGANRTTDEAERSECVTLKGEIETLDIDLSLLRFHEKGLSATAQPVAGNGHFELYARPSVPATVKAPEPEPGIRVARLMRCKALAHHEQADIARIAERDYGTRDPRLVQIIKAGEIPAMTTTAGGDGFIPAESGFGDYAEFLRPQTILGKFGQGGIPPLRRVPFRSGLVTMDTGAIGYWVGEAKPKPLTMIDSSRKHLLPLKTAAIIVLTMELVRDSSPSAELAIRADMTQAIVARIDETFIDPAVVAVAGVSPASITNGQPAIPSSGADADAVRLDLRSLFAQFDAASNPASQAVLVMSTANARALGFATNPLGQPDFPGMSVSGGSLLGVPVIVSDYAGDTVTLISASDVYLADEGGVAIDLSTEASLEMSSTPTQHADGTPAGAAMVSLWQGNLVGFRAERTINWDNRRAVVAPYLTGVEWGEPLTITPGA